MTKNSNQGVRSCFNCLIVIWWRLEPFARRIEVLHCKSDLTIGKLAVLIQYFVDSNFPDRRLFISDIVQNASISHHNSFRSVQSPHHPPPHPPPYPTPPISTPCTPSFIRHNPIPSISLFPRSCHFVAFLPEDEPRAGRWNLHLHNLPVFFRSLYIACYPKILIFHVQFCNAIYASFEVGLSSKCVFWKKVSRRMPRRQMS